MQYLARFQPDGDGFVVTFPSLPEAITGGASEDEAVANAIDAMEVVLLTYALDGRPVPPDDSPRRGAGLRLLRPSAMVAAKLAFMTAFRESGLTRVALAAKLGKAEGEIRRMLDPYHATKIATLETALLALGKRLIVSVEAA